MEPLQLSGLASGFDWQSVVDRLIEIERVPQNRLRVEQIGIDRQLSALSDLEGKLEALQTSAVALQAGDTFLGRAVAYAGGEESSTVVDASAAPGTEARSYALNVIALATASTRSGAADVGSAISPTSDVSGVTLATMNLVTDITAGTFSVNGAQVTVDPADSLQDVFDAISTATGGQVTAAYDPVGDVIDLTSASPITLGSGADTSNFLAATKLFGNGTGSVSSASALGVVDMDAPIASSSLATAITNVDGNGDGTFDINGVTIDFNVNNDSIATVAQRIADSGAGVSLSYDITTDQFTLTNTDTGSLGIGVSETAGGFLEAIGLNTGATDNLGQNAQFTLDGGGTLTSTSNTFDESVHGVAGLSLTARAAGTETVTVSADPVGAREAVDAFIESYNDLQTFIETSTAVTVAEGGDVTTAVLTENREVDRLGEDLRQLVFGTVASLQGEVKRLQDMGIDFVAGSHRLEVDDEARLDEVLESDGPAVVTLFTDPAEGLGVVLDGFVDAFLDPDGTLETQRDVLSGQDSSLEEQIANMDRLIEQRRSILIESFIRMEEVQSEVNSQLQLLSGSFSG